MEAKSEVSDGSLLLLVAFLLVNALNCHLSLVLALVVQGDAVNCNTRDMFNFKPSTHSTCLLVPIEKILFSFGFLVLCE